MQNEGECRQKENYFIKRRKMMRLESSDYWYDSISYERRYDDW